MGSQVSFTVRKDCSSCLILVAFVLVSVEFYFLSPSHPHNVAGQVTGLFPYGGKERWHVRGYRIINVVLYCEGVIPVSTVSTREWYCTVAVRVVVWLCDF